MSKVGIRELKAHTGEFVQSVEDEHETYEISVEGEATVILEPVESRADPEVHRNYWEWHRKLAEAITDHWEGDVNSAEAIREQRRDR